MWYHALHLLWEEMEAIKKILRLEIMLSICLFFETSELKYAYKLYAYKKQSVLAHLCIATFC